MPGVQGPQGEPGEDGADGQDGADGTLVNIATTAEAETGTSNDGYMTPLRTAEAFNHRLSNNITFAQNVQISGNLTVQGTETVLNTETLNIEDKNIVLGNVATPTDTTANEGGITLKGATDKTITYVQANNRWASNVGFSAPSLFVGANAVATESYVTTAVELKENRIARLSTITTNNYTIGTNLDDIDTTTVLLVDSSSTLNIILPSTYYSGTTIPTGAQITIVRRGTGRVTVSPASGVTIQSAQGHLAIRDRYASIAAIYLGNLTWLVVGSLEV